MTLNSWIYAVSTANSLRALRRSRNNEPMEVEKEPRLTNDELKLIETIGTVPIIQIPYMMAFGLGLAVRIIKKVSEDILTK